MKSELAREVFALIESEVLSRPSPMEFEMAYQARVAVERIRSPLRRWSRVEASQSAWKRPAYSCSRRWIVSTLSIAVFNIDSAPAAFGLATMRTSTGDLPASVRYLWSRKTTMANG